MPPADPPVEVRAQRDLADRVPDELRESGTLTVGTDPSYPPMEYVTGEGLLSGVDIALAQAVAATLDLTPQFQPEAFSALEASVKIGRFHTGIAGLSIDPGTTWDTDVVAYLESGTKLARRAGTSIDLTSLCGHRISVMEGTTQVEELAVRSEQCTAAGAEPVDVIAEETVEKARMAVIDATVDAMVADSPVVQFAVAQDPQALELVEGVASPTALGILVDAAHPGLAHLIGDAIDALIADGSYDAILRANGLSDGAIGQTFVLPSGQAMPDHAVTGRPTAEG